MRDYATVSPRFWVGETGRKIRAFGRDAQVIALYLVTCPSSNMIGLYYLPIPTLCHEIGISSQGALKALRSLFEGGFCTYDEVSETVFVTAMARYQIGESLSPKDNRVKAIRKEAEKLRKSPLYVKFHALYGERFHFADMSPSEAPSEPLRSQEQEQEQEQEIHTGDSSSPTFVLGSGSGDEPRAGLNGKAIHPDRYEVEFETEIRPLYPKRDGDQRWKAARRHYRVARKAGETRETMAEGVRRYAAWCDARGLVGTRRVKQAGTFFGEEKCWREAWGESANGAPAEELVG